MPDIDIREFCKIFCACKEGQQWAEDNCNTMQDVWNTAPADYLTWVATRSGVTSYRQTQCATLAALVWLFDGGLEVDEPAVVSIARKILAHNGDVDNEYYEKALKLSDQFLADCKKNDELIFSGRLSRKGSSKYSSRYAAKVLYNCLRHPLDAFDAIDDCALVGAQFFGETNDEIYRQVMRVAAAWFRKNTTPCFDDEYLYEAHMEEIEAWDAAR